MLEVCVMLDGSMIPWSLQFVMGATAMPHRKQGAVGQEQENGNKSSIRLEPTEHGGV